MIVSLSDIFFTVVRTGVNKVTVKEGCIFHYTGRASNIVTNTYDNGASGAAFFPEDLFTDSNTNDDLGTHIFIDEQEFEIESTTKLWLSWTNAFPSMNWGMTVTDDTGSIIPDGLYPIGSPLDFDSSVNVPITVRDQKLIRQTLQYTLSPTEMNGILIAEIEYNEDLGEIQSIDQIHEGLIFVGRFQDFPGASALV